MTLKNASQFLFIGSVFWIFSELFKQFYFFSFAGMDGFSIVSTLYFIVGILSAILFQVIALSFKPPQYNPIQRKQTGIFLAIVGGGWLLLGLYFLWLSVSQGWFREMPLLFVFGRITYTLLPLSFLLLGIALAGGKNSSIRNAAVWISIAGGVWAAFLGYTATSTMRNHGVMDRGLLGGLNNVVNILDVVTPLAITVWGIALYKRKAEQEKKDNLKDTPTIDDLD